MCFRANPWGGVDATMIIRPSKLWEDGNGGFQMVSVVLVVVMMMTADDDV